MELLNQAYNQETYLNFLAGKFIFSKNLAPIKIDNKEVEKFKKLGFITVDNKELPVFEIHIKPKTQLARNRVQLRNMVAKQIQIEDGALAVYVDKANKQWRFSFIAIEWALTDEGIKQTQTASKRFTYLLGKDAKTKTAENRFKLLNKQSTLDNFKAAFAVEPLNKEFYDKLYTWYKKASQQVIFPNDEKAKNYNDKEVENHKKTSLIRLLTRLLFVWFLKEKHLINKDLFNLEKLKTLIKYDKDSSFYKAILQNLFFATLNRSIIDRSFRRTTNGEANSNNYLVTNIYRYQKLFQNTDQQTIIQLFAKIPFLNGGLFECLDREATNEEKQAYDNDSSIRPVKSAIRTDGFSDKDSNELAFDNSLFFNDDEQDLGLISLFNQYQFTVEESTPADIEVALDPELLGKVFENLLASYNPETGEQARKATGSFYTPRKIVNYMVDESLKQHFKTHTELKNEQINTLFTEDKNELTKSQIKTIINAIDTLKILDPAVGSGAYPMGILQRLVFILTKIDPENIHFKQQQLAKAELMDEVSKKASIQAIEKVFSKDKQHNTYGKKLFLIENCIYGVDIQPIAIQISKLRFFISLTIEQTANTDKNDNYGITALPNLETQFIVANTLLPIEKIPDTGQLGMFDKGINELQQQLVDVRHQYFSAKTIRTKRKYRDEDKELRNQMLIRLTESGITPAVEQSMQKVVDWDLYNQNSISDWFDPQWMFGVKQGFDIVLGNPPYVTYGLDKRYKTVLQAANIGINGVRRNARNLFAYFIEKSIALLKDKGTLILIVPHSISRVDGYQYIRKFINENSVLWHIVDEYDQFNNVTLEMVTLFCSKNIDKPEYIKSFSKRDNKIYEMPNNIYDISGYYPIYYDEIYKKIKKYPADRINGRRGFSDLHEYALGDILHIGGKNIKPYNIEFQHGEYYINKQNFGLKNEEIVITQFGSSPRGTIIDTRKIIPSSGCVIITHTNDLLPKFVLAFINSKVIKYFFDRYIVNNASLTVHLDGHYLKKLPIPKIPTPAQQPFIDLVNKILTTKQTAENTIALEAEIDKMVYQLYNLTTAEINIIEAN